MAVNIQQSSDRDRLVRDYLPLAHRLAQRYRHTSETMEDLIQVASMGLVQAAERFDPDRGTSFASFAVPTIVGELRRHLRDRAWAARVPRSVQENLLRVSAAREAVGGRLGRSPTPRELAEESGLSSEDVLEAMEAAHAYEAESLDQRTGDDESADALVSIIGAEDDGYERVEQSAMLWPAAATLTQQERVILALRFFEDLTQSEIAARIGVSQMQVSRVLRRALDRIHTSAGLAA